MKKKERPEVTEVCESEEKVDISSYTSPKTYGDRFLRDLHNETVYVQEKLDGSQFSFMWDPLGNLHCRTRGGSTISPEFQPLIDYIRSHSPGAGFIFRGEALMRPRQNKLTYAREPKNNFVLFDVYDIAGENYLTPEEAERAAKEYDFDYAPILRVLEPGEVFTTEMFDEIYKNTQSVLGGPIEGVVLKNYHRVFPLTTSKAAGKLMAAKFVAPEFQEKTKIKTSPGDKTSEFLTQLAQSYAPPARYDKAIQRLRDNNLDQGSMKDVGALIREVHKDIDEECSEDIKEALYKYFRKTILKEAAQGLPEHYRMYLARGEGTC